MRITYNTVIKGNSWLDLHYAVSVERLSKDEHIIHIWSFAVDREKVRMKPGEVPIAHKSLSVADIYREYGYIDGDWSLSGAMKLVFSNPQRFFTFY